MKRSHGFSSLVRTGIGILAANYVKLVYHTGRFSKEPADPIEFSASLGPVIIATWHGQNMILPPFWHHCHPLEILVSRHDDADIGATAYRALGLNVIRGSGSPPGKARADKGGAGALRQMVRSLKRGSSVGLTADMPPGPARRAGRGIIMLAQMSGHPILPLAVTTRHRLVSNNWCRYAVNLPFSRGSIAVGQTIEVPRNADEHLIEKKRQQLENALNVLTARADFLAGRQPQYETGGPAPGLPLSYYLYRAATYLVSPLAPLWLKYRCSQGKEVDGRTQEKLGQKFLQRPQGKLIWIHAASVGETISCLKLIETLLDGQDDLHILVTTATVSAAEVLAERIPEGACHQYAPLDLPGIIQKFLNHWRPDLAVFAESEIWPNTIVDLTRRNISIAMVNGRISHRSFKRWSRAARLIRALLARFDHISAQSSVAEQRLAALGARQVSNFGNMKADISRLAVAPKDLKGLQKQIGRRPFWLAASTHPGEELSVINCHKLLSTKFPNLLTIIVPRHRERADEVAVLAEARNLTLARRSRSDLISKKTDVYLADTLGEMNLFYALAPISFIGGSLVEIGGHNPIEAIDGGSAVLHGPLVDNFQDIYQLLDRHDGALEVIDEKELVASLARLLGSKQLCATMISNSKKQAATLKGATERTARALLDLLDQKAPGVQSKRGD